MAGRPRQQLRREFVVLHPLGGHEPGVIAIGAGREEALLADVQAPVGVVVQVAQFHVRRQALRQFRPQAAFVPVDRHRSHVAAGREVEPHDRFRGKRLGVFAFDLDALDAGWRVEQQRPIHSVQNVARHIAQRAAAEVIPAAPVERLVFRVIRTRRGRADPQVPVQRLRNFFFRQRMIDALRPDGTVGPGVHFLDRADLAGPDHFAQLPDAFARVALVAHLRGDAIFARRITQHAGLEDRPGHGLLAVDVFAALHGPHRRDGVGVVGSGNGHRVDVAALLVQHHPVVFVRLGVRKLLERLGGVVPIGVRQGDDVVPHGTAHDVAMALATGADRGDVQLLIGGLVAQSLQRRRALALQFRGRQRGRRS